MLSLMGVKGFKSVKRSATVNGAMERVGVEKARRSGSGCVTRPKPSRR